MRAFVVVLDSVGIGAAPDAAEYGDAGSNTLAHTAAAVGGLSVPTLQAFGLGNIPAITGGDPILGVPPSATPLAGFGAMQEVSTGKDTTTGHWEIAGLHLEQGLHVFPAGPPSFPAELISTLESHTHRKVIGNKAASGTAIIEELGEEQMQTGAWIAYTSADSVFQIAAHEEVIPLEELYEACRLVRKQCNALAVGRVIARPYLGEPGSFARTENRRDFSYPLPEPSILSLLSETGVDVISVGKLDDIFPDSGITESYHVENNPDAAAAVLSLAKRPPTTQGAFVFANLIDFDMLYGHRRDPEGYAKALESTDRFLNELRALLRDDDLLVITADHGNDPTFTGTDHTREYVPLLAYCPKFAGTSLGIRMGFFDIAQTLTDWFRLENLSRGKSFYSCNGFVGVS
ncbi:MAG: phosphopentomutase [Verrucomicrobia bacterium]|nr:phosphopentomutase [Verrucomicrobiota bacterium]